jgi:hypothetical protein
MRLLHELLRGMSIASVKQPLMNGVTAVHRTSCMAIELRHGRGCAPRQLLQPYRESGRVQPPPPPIEMEGTFEYEVESILEHRFWGIKNLKPITRLPERVMVSSIILGNLSRMS